ncbi:hypothetical protein TUMSATVNIG3_16650 [Vibrio nigripulchritudo]|nr:hypothetical protein TUMSATVNIG2_16240 [Vibrio nigripulchritudo]BDU42867.1 hypothetical protein TUMSATVNIG3_16650 [Vibrio nigripulchritudo]
MSKLTRRVKSRIINANENANMTTIEATASKWERLLKPFLSSKCFPKHLFKIR